jgi:aminopeptidase YwaD
MGSLKATKENIDYIFKFTDAIVNGFPNRLPGSDACLKAGKVIADEFGQTCDKGSVKTEEFTFHPKAFLKYIKIEVVVYLLSVALVLFNKPVIALVILAVGLAMFLGQFAFYWEVFDPFFPKGKGMNVYGSIEPEKEVKQQIIVCGHHDAAYVFHYLSLSTKFYPLMLAAGIAPFFITLGGILIMLIFGIQPMWMKIVMMALSAGVLPLWFFTTDKVSPGAGDNMVAVALANETVKIFAAMKKDKNNPLQHTRVICCSVDAEESGLRGSRAFTKRHKKEMTDTKTYAFCIDNLYKADKLIFFNNDLNFTVDLSDKMAQELKGIADGLGYGARVTKMPWGGGSTDAASFAQQGIEAICMLSFEIDIANLDADFVYHTEKDDSSAVEPRCVEQTLNVVLEYIQKKDAEVSQK